MGARSDGPARRAVVLCAPLVAALGMLVISLGSPTPAGGETARDGITVRTSSTYESAATIYLRDCAECHGENGRGSSNGPPIATAGAAYVDYAMSTGRMPIDEPTDPIERGPVDYSPTEIAGVAEHVASLDPRGNRALPIPDVDISDADIANGGELYRANCAACHQSVGVGGAMTDRAAPSVHEATALQVVEAVRVGPFQMPAFGESAMTDQEVEDVAAYVTEVLQDPEDRGGLSIWHLGPVPEGAVAIVIGLGLMVLATVWIEGRVRRARVDAGDRSTGRTRDEGPDG